MTSSTGGAGRDGPGDGRSLRSRLMSIALIAAVFVVLAGTGDALIRREIQRGDARGDAQLEIEADAIDASIEAEFATVLDLSAGLQAYVSAYPELEDRQRLDTFLNGIFDVGHHLRDITLAPDDVVVVVHPLDGNEAVLGVDYRDLPEQFDAIQLAAQRRRTVIDGPLELIQGGVAMIARTPVFLDGDRRWGTVSLVIETTALFGDIRSDDVESDDVDWAVRLGPEALEPGRAIYGNVRLFDDAAEIRTLSIGGEQWELAVRGDPTTAGERSQRLALRMAALVGSAGVTGLLVVLNRQRATVTRQALRDPLTGAANRLRFQQRIDELIGHGQRRDDGFVLVTIDLNSFKAVNDRFGHAAGDEVLRTVTHGLREAVRDGDLVARVGGDEFMVLLPGLSTDDDIGPVIDRLVAALAKPIDRDVGDLSVGAALGYGRFPNDATTADGLMAAVDDAMYRAKRSPGGAVRVAAVSGAVTSPSDAKHR